MNQRKSARAHRSHRRGERGKRCPGGAFAVRQKRPERVIRNKQCETLQASNASIEDVEHWFEYSTDHIKSYDHPCGGHSFLLCPAPDIEPGDPRCETSTGESRRGPPVAEISSAAFSTETSELSSGQSRRLRLRNTGSTL